MVGIRSPIGLVVGSCTSHPGVLGSIPKREEPGKTGAPCVKVPGSSRVPRTPRPGGPGRRGFSYLSRNCSRTATCFCGAIPRPPSKRVSTDTAVPQKWRLWAPAYISSSLTCRLVCCTNTSPARPTLPTFLAAHPSFSKLALLLETRACVALTQGLEGRPVFGELLRDTALGRDDGLRGLLGLLVLRDGGR